MDLVLLKTFLEQGARKFIFEGRECGGHVGPRSSLSLWQSAIDVLTDAGLKDPSKVQLLFAGGVHDALSAAMVQTLAAPLMTPLMTPLLMQWLAVRNQPAKVFGSLSLSSAPEHRNVPPWVHTISPTASRAVSKAFTAESTAKTG